MGASVMGDPFVGRATELAELDRRLELVTAGQGQVVVLAGPAGVGKTALVARCLARWDSAALALVTSGDEAETATEGALLSQLAQPGVAAADDFAPTLESAGSDPVSVGSALLRSLRGLAQSRPLVVVVDDAQWGDELSLLALSFAARRLRADRVLCVLVTRTDGLDRLPAGLRRAAAERGAPLLLDGLSASDVAALAELAGAGRLPGRAAERLKEHTAGIPLHIWELLHDLPAEALRSPGATLPAPRSLQTLVVSRLAVCSKETEALVVSAAVLGRQCDLADAAALAGLRDPLPALQEAIAQRLLVESDAGGRRRCAFPHAVIRAAVYQDIGVSRRAALHRAAAVRTDGNTALAHRTAGCPATDPQLAADLADHAAAERAAGQLAEAAEHLLMAARVAGNSREAERRLLEAVTVLIDLGDAAGARSYSSQIASMSPSAQRDLLLGRLALLAGAIEPAEQHISRAWAVLAPGVQNRAGAGTEAGAQAACELALMLMGRYRLADAASWARRSEDAATTGFARACSRAVRCGALAAAGQAQPASELLEAELARCTDDAARALLHAGLGSTLLHADDLPGAAVHLTAAATLGEGCLPRSHLLEARLLQVALAYRSGHWDRAAAESDRLITLLDDLDQAWLRGRAHLAAVCIAAGRGSWRAAASHADAAAAAPGLGDIAMADARTAIAVARDDPEAIMSAAAAAVADLGLLGRLEPGRLSFWPAYAEALARTGEHDEASRVLSGYEERAAACGRRSAMAAASRARGLLHACLQNTDDALAALDASVRWLNGLGLPFDEAKTRLERGRVLRRGGQRRAAVRDISEARALFAALGAQPFVARCDDELGATTFAVAGLQRTPLTARQLAVARAAAAGKTNRQIAAELYVSVKTVEFHLGQILTRLAIDSRVDIAGALAAAGGRTSAPTAAALGR